MEKMREEFKKWFYDNAGLDCKFDSYNNAFVTESSRTTGDTIVNTSCCIAWQSWQASRAALCVELPKIHNLAVISDPLMDADDVKWALEDAGVQYK